MVRVPPAPESQTTGLWAGQESATPDGSRDDHLRTGREGQFPTAVPLRADELIYVAGHSGLAGGAIHRRLQETGHRPLIGPRSSYSLPPRSAGSSRTSPTRADFLSEKIGLEQGIRSTYEWFVEHRAKARV